MITIDGSHGEGGGQIIRTSLALSLITGKPFRVHRVRARRERPGLARQHLTGVLAAAAIGNARVEGARLGATEFTFDPGLVAPVGAHLADQLLVPLALAGGGAYTTGQPSPHTMTNIEIIKLFLDVRSTVRPLGGDVWKIQINGYREKGKG